MTVSRDSEPLLAADEPAPFEVLNAEVGLPLLLLCDHASKRLPRALGDLGLDAAARNGHLAVDIGAGDLVRRLAAMTGATAVLAGYSRLAVDPNRKLSSADAFLAFSDGIAIAGNRDLSQAERQARADALYWPYHRAVDEQVRRLATRARKPVILSIHSFSPVFNQRPREWEFGVLWKADQHTAGILLRGLRAAGFQVGDNQPYSAHLPLNHTLEHHAESAGLPHAIIEVRQDLLADDAGIARIAAVLQPIVARLRAEITKRGKDGVSAQALGG